MVRAALRNEKGRQRAVAAGPDRNFSALADDNVVHDDPFAVLALHMGGNFLVI